MLVGLFFNEVMFFGGIIFWAMPSARATPGSLPLGCLWRTKPCVSLSQFLFWVFIKFFGEFFLSDTFRCWWDYFLMKLCFLVELFFGRCLRPGLLRARLRSVAFGEPSPTYPYRNYCFGCLLSFLVELFLGDVFREENYI